MKKLLLTLSLLFIITQVSFSQQTPSAGAMYEFIVNEVQTELSGYQMSFEDLDPSELSIIQIPEYNSTNTVIPTVNLIVRSYSDVHYSDGWAEYKDGYASILVIDEIEAYYLVYYVEQTNRILVTFMTPNKYRSL